MKNLFTAFILGIALAGVSLAQGPSKAARGTTMPKMAVVEFTSGANASGMTDQAKQLLQSSLAAAINHTREFDIYDTRHTRNASQGDLAAVNGTSTAAAVKVGKQLGVAYVVTGTVTAYDTKGSATVKARVVEVATGKVAYSGETSQQAVMKMTDVGSAVEMQSKVIKPLVLKLTATITAEL